MPVLNLGLEREPEMEESRNRGARLLSYLLFFGVGERFFELYSNRNSLEAMRLAGSLDLELARMSFIYLFFRNKSYENCLCWKARTGNWKRWVCGWLVGIKSD